MLGGAGVLLRVSGHRALELAGPRLLAAVLVSGFAAFLLVAVLLVAGGQALLEYPPAHAYPLIVLVETAAAIAIGCTLAALFAGAVPREDSPP